jgi:predicted CXXCH cytochrome family protein
MKTARAFAIAILLMAISISIANATSTENCKKCHTDEYEAWHSSAHYNENGPSPNKPRPETCIPCHSINTPRLYSTMYGEVSAESPECEMCHQPPEEGFTAHITNPSEAVPPLNLSAEICEDCHAGPHHAIYEEWNEYDRSDYSPALMKSHSEPSSKDNVNNGLESVITCVMCHKPHNTELRMEAQELCASCHSSNASPAESQYVVAGGPQWEMYNESIYTNDVHAVNLECVDCHMTTITDEAGEQKLITGHSFDFDPVLLSDPDSGNTCKKCHVTGHDKIPESGDCDDCHEVSLFNITASHQKLTADKLQELEILQENASKVLLMPDDNISLETLTRTYNEAVAYIEFVKADGSLGMHNVERTDEYLEKAETLLRSITGEENTDIDNQETEIHDEEEQKENTAPGAEVTDLFLTIFITAIVISLSKKKRGK